MSITGQELVAAAESLLGVAATLNPQAAVAAAGVEALQKLFSKLTETNKMFHNIMMETGETAPEVAKEVMSHVFAADKAWDASVKANPGT